LTTPKGQRRAVLCQRRSLPSPGAVQTLASAPWLGSPWRRSAGRWAVPTAGSRSGNSALRPASPPGVRRVLGVPGARRPTRLQRSHGPAATDATASRQLRRAASGRKCCGSLWGDTTSRHSPPGGRSLASSRAMPGGDRTRRAIHRRRWLMALKRHRALVAGCESPHGEPVMRDAGCA
jgi:hypothetical protein